MTSTPGRCSDITACPEACAAESGSQTRSWRCSAWHRSTSVSASRATFRPKPLSELSFGLITAAIGGCCPSLKKNLIPAWRSGRDAANHQWMSRPGRRPVFLLSSWWQWRFSEPDGHYGTFYHFRLAEYRCVAQTAKDKLDKTRSFLIFSAPSEVQWNNIYIYIR